MTKPCKYPESPFHIWNQFYELSQIPRPSKHEEKVREYVVSLARDKNLEFKVDTVGNVIIYVPASTGRESEEPLLIQNHLDMVTDAVQGKDFDFMTEAIPLLVDGEWLTADGTTLGADNGIGCAAALALLFDDQVSHPPLELLFTIDEETGLNGALGLEAKYFKSKRMLNLDTEEWGSLYVGCAGGIDYELTKDIDLTNSTLPKRVKVNISGFTGGHSGVDIHEERGNAIQFLAQGLNRFSQKSSLEVVEFRGGRAHNIIPREAFVIVNIENESELSSIFASLKNEWLGFLPEKDQAIDFSIEELESSSSEVISIPESKKFLNLLTLLPHGVHHYENPEEKMVSCSNNLARVLFVRGKFYTQLSLRFFDRNQVKKIEERLESLGDIFNLKVESHSEYPSWKPNFKSPLLDFAKNVYQEIFEEEAQVKAIHAGLECGILKDKLGEMDVISLGPTITGAHSPDERIHIESVTKFWNYYTNLLREI